MSAKSTKKKIKREPGTITDQQRVLCNHYAATRDWKAAAELTGMSYDYVRTISTLSHIRECVAEILQKQVAKIEVQQHQVIEAAACLAFSDLTETLHCNEIEDFKALPERVRQAIAGVDYDIGLFRQEDGTIVSRRYIKRVRMHNKTESIKLLALATNITVPLRDRDIADRPSLVGISYITGDQVSNEEKCDDDAS